MMVGEKSSIIPLLMVRGKKSKRLAVRITGGCGFMEEDGKSLYRYANAFKNIEGLVVIGGGTRMLNLPECKTIRPGITELLPRIKKVNPSAQTVGIAPRIEEESTPDEEGMVMSMEMLDDRIVFFHHHHIRHEASVGYVTAFMPGNDILVQIQKDVDTGCKWFDEVMTAVHWMRLMQEEADFKLATVFYNGGSTTERELLMTVRLGWPAILIKGSGRVTDKYANDAEFLAANPNVIVVETPRQLQKVLEAMNK